MSYSYKRSLKKRQQRKLQQERSTLKILKEKQKKRIKADRRVALKGQVRLDRIPSSLEYWILFHTQYQKRTNEAIRTREYDLLVANPRIAEIRVTLDAIRIKTKPVIATRTNAQGSPSYFLGVYAIDIFLTRIERISRQQFQVTCLESGRHDGQKLPLYVNSSFGFCFGTRLTFIQKMLSSGEFFTAVAVMMDSLWHINESEGGLLQYRTVRRGIVEPASGVVIPDMPYNNMYPGYMGAGYYG